MITDDTGVQGKNHTQLEVNGGLSQDSSEVSAILSAGLSDSLDIVVGVPFQIIRIKEAGSVTSFAEGLADVSLELKWRSFARGGWSLALKPGASFPTGNEAMGLGAGRTAYNAFAIVSKEIDRAALHLNLGYIRGNNAVGEKQDLWHLSAAGSIDFARGFQAVANIVAERNPDPASNIIPAKVVAGFIYSPLAFIDFDLGFKHGINSADASRALLAGLALRY